MADSYRTGLLHLLRLATREADAVDIRQRETLLIGPIESRLKAEAGPFASLDASSLAPSPFDFQRVHCNAINVRLATVYVRSKAVQKHHRLYRVDKPGSIQAAIATTNAAAEEAEGDGRQRTGGGDAGDNAPGAATLAIPFHGATTTIADASAARIGQVG